MTQAATAPGIIFGAQGFAVGEQMRKEQAARRENMMPFRFFQNVGQSSLILFLDDPLAFVNEHVLYSQRATPKMTYVTCGKPFFGSCPACAAMERNRKSGISNNYTQFGTILNLTGYTKQDGTVVRCNKQLIALGKNVQQKMPDKRGAAQNDLTMTIWKFTRYDKQAGTGEDFDFIGRTTMAKILEHPDYRQYLPQDVSPEEFFKPFDYAKILTPPSLEHIDAVVKNFLGQTMTYASPVQSVATPSLAVDSLVSPSPEGPTASPLLTTAGSEDIRGLL